MEYTLHLGDCLEIMAGMEENSVDAIVTDPPYGLGFMGKHWDHGVPGVDFWTQALRIAKPGAHLLAFGGTRTFHRLAVAIEDAGWEMRDTVMWVYGSGFPKSLDVSKKIDQQDATKEQEQRRLRFTAWVRSTGATSRQIDEATGTQMGSHYTTHSTQPAIMTREHLEMCRPLLGDVPAWVEQECDIRSIESQTFAEREVIGNTTKARSSSSNSAIPTVGADTVYRSWDITAPATPEAQRWAGWGTALKPAWEPVIVARKPLAGTVAANVLEWGTGAINVDGCRVAALDGVPSFTHRSEQSANCYGDGRNGSNRTGETSTAGRWPANVIHDGSDEVLSYFPAAPGQQADISPTAPSPKTGNVYGKMNREGEASANDENAGMVGFKMRPGARRLDTGSAARFFYCAKASKAERDAGLEGMPLRGKNEVYGKGLNTATKLDPRPHTTEGVANRPLRSNHHPTVKPVSLMRYLCRLITPPGGTVLDPFMGSGSTGVAALLEGFHFAGIEMEQEYIDIAQRRIDWAKRQMLFNPQPLPLWAGEVHDYAEA